MNYLKKLVRAVAARTPLARDLLHLRELEKEVLQYKRELNLIGDMCKTYSN